MRAYLAVAMAAASIIATPAAAAPGLGDKVYGATVEAGETEFEARYGRLVGDDADGEDALKLEVARGFSSRFYGAVIGEFEREPHEQRRLEAFAVEGIYTLGKVAGVDAAVYGEYEVGLHGPDALETKLLLQKRAGEFDARLNLIAEKPLRSGSPIELGYAASADVEAIGELRLGLAAFGELGTTRHVTTRSEHFIGPVAKFEIEHLPGRGELEVESGYRFAVGKARDESNGQFRLLLEYALHF
jgi:hypothetical protein